MSNREDRDINQPSLPSLRTPCSPLLHLRVAVTSVRTFWIVLVELFAHHPDGYISCGYAINVLDMSWYEQWNSSGWPDIWTCHIIANSCNSSYCTQGMARPVIPPLTILPTAPETFSVLEQRMRVAEEQAESLISDLQALGIISHRWGFAL